MILYVTYITNIESIIFTKRGDDHWNGNKIRNAAILSIMMVAVAGVVFGRKIVSLKIRIMALCLESQRN